MSDLTSPLKPGETRDLHGVTIVLTAPLIVPVGCCTVRNGTISFLGNGGVPGSGGMSPFNTNKGSGQIILEGLRFQIPPKAACVKTSEGGRVHLKRCTHTAGAIAWCEGADAVEISQCTPLGVPDRYWFINATHLLKMLRIDNAGIQQPVRQGEKEAAIRLMQVMDSLIQNLTVEGIGYKQCVQDRPGGKKGAVFKQHIWRNVTVRASAEAKKQGKFGGVDLGNFQDTSDVNYPFGTLLLSRWEKCHVDKFTKTYDGKGAFGIAKFQQV